MCLFCVAFWLFVFLWPTKIVTILLANLFRSVILGNCIIAFPIFFSYKNESPGYFLAIDAPLLLLHVHLFSRDRQPPCCDVLFVRNWTEVGLVKMLPLFSIRIRYRHITCYLVYIVLQVSQWLGVLQAVVMVPVMLRMLRRRYKMPWTCLLHSQLYLVVQAVDLAAVVSLAAGADNRSLRLTAEVSVYLAWSDGWLDGGRGFLFSVCLAWIVRKLEVSVYLASVYLCVCCMALATPPVYIGHRIVRR